MLAAPAQALSLDMNQASLNDNPRPDCLDRVESVRIAVNRGAFGPQAVALKVSAEREQIWRAFFDAIGRVEDSMCAPVHHGKHSVSMLKECSVQDEILIGRHLSAVQEKFWRSFEPVMNNALDGCATVAALLNELANAVALGNPATKPYIFTLVTRTTCRPTECSMA
jgi:hypothetical protein